MEPDVVPDIQRPAAVDVTCEFGDGRRRLVNGGELDDARPSRSTRHGVKQNLGRHDFARRLEQFHEIFV